jgi:hypothetical protein
VTVASALRAARAKIERGWCKNDYAVDEEGLSVLPTNPRATNFCAVGALRSLGLHIDLFIEAERALSSQIGWEVVVDWNDKRGRTKQDVLDLYDQAIASLEKAP